jgi:hypothetical protein
MQSVGGDGGWKSRWAGVGTVKGHARELAPSPFPSWMVPPTRSSFPSPFTSARLHAEQSGSLVVADFNNDGELDVAGIGTGTLGTVISVYLGDGNGVITWAHNSLIRKDSGLFVTAATADFDGDGIADIGVTVGDGIAIAHGKGTGYFQPAYFYPTGAAGGLVAGDLDGDGTPDVAMTTEGQDSVVVFLNKQ